MSGSIGFTTKIMIILTFGIITFSFLPFIPISNDHGDQDNGGYFYDYPLMRNEDTALVDNWGAWIIFFSFAIQLIGWIGLAYIQKYHDKENELLLKIFSQQYILIANLATILGLILWRDAKINDHISLKWGYYFALGLVLLSFIANTLIWLKNRESSLLRKSDQPVLVHKKPLGSNNTEAIKSMDEPKISRKERKEIERKATEEMKLLAAQESETLRKQEIEVEIRDRVEKFRKIVMRSAKLRIEQLASMLRMEQTDLLDWLYDLPEEFGFVINQDIIEFDTAKIGDSIDKLLAGFDSVDRTKDGKI